MSYGTVEARVQTLLQGLTSVFTPTTAVTRGDWRVLDRGYANSAVLFPAPFDQTENNIAPGGNIVIWKVKLELFKKYSSAVYTTFGTMRDAVIEHLFKYPTLNSLADCAVLPNLSGAELVEVFDKDNNGPFFLSQVLTLSVSNIVTVTLAE